MQEIRDSWIETISNWSSARNSVLSTLRPLPSISQNLQLITKELDLWMTTLANSWTWLRSLGTQTVTTYEQ